MKLRSVSTRWFDTRVTAYTQTDSPGGNTLVIDNNIYYYNKCDIFVLLAYDAKERQHWVNRLRATAEYHSELSSSSNSSVSISTVVTHTHTHNRLTAFGPGQPRWAGTRRNIHPLTPILIIGHPLSTSPFTTIHSILCVQFTCLTVLFDNLSAGPLWSSSWSWNLNFILHTFLHPIIIFFSQHML